jgi:murein DD-endopeptidase MepM/ murein hydrolase activator NlpD
MLTSSRRTRRSIVAATVLAVTGLVGGAAGPAAAQGGWPCPMTGDFIFEKPFDPPDHNGVDLYPKGQKAKLVAVSDGFLNHTTDARGGNVITINNGERLFIYAHVAKYIGGPARGVFKGEVIGTISKKPQFVPHLYFEMRNFATNVPLNPTKKLERACPQGSRP